MATIPADVENAVLTIIARLARISGHRDEVNDHAMLSEKVKFLLDRENLTHDPFVDRVLASVNGAGGLATDVWELLEKKFDKPSPPPSGFNDVTNLRDVGKKSQGTKKT